MSAAAAAVLVFAAIAAAVRQSPQSASPLKVSLVPSFKQCGGGGNPTNSRHAAPFAIGTCNPPKPSAAVARVGDQSVNSAELNAIPGNPSTQANEADFSVAANLTDIRATSTTGGDYNPNTGSDLNLVARFRITDLGNCTPRPCTGPYTADATMVEVDYSVPINCTSNADPTIGSTCALSTTANAVTPGLILEGNRTNVQVFRVRINESTGTLFEQQGYAVDPPPPPPAPGPNDPPPPDPATIAPPIDRTTTTPLIAATSFLYTGANPTQVGVTSGTIDPKRVAVVRGAVKDRSGAPIPGVRITVLDHPELGRTATRTDGGFLIAVNGGGPLTLSYDRQGYIPVQRQLTVPWQDYVDLDDVVMIPYDQRATTIDLASPTVPDIQVAAGNPVTDADGTRQAFLFFAKGTHATMKVGQSDQALPTLKVRATEFTVGPTGKEAMPAELPPTSGYTYAAEFSVDQAVSAEATKVSFDRPVISYVDNFLGFDVGTTIPAGSYDRQSAQWKPETSGKVIKIVSETNGRADIDMNGDDQADDTSGLGVTDAERVELATIYDPGKSLWRVPRDHFSVDYNWRTSPPQNAIAPGQLRPGDVEDPCHTGGSDIECENQTLGEDLPVSDTPFSLHYQSDRVPGRTASNTLEIPLSGASVPQSLKRIEVEATVAGRRYTDTRPGAADQSYTLSWDGKDVFGRTLQGAQPATIRIGYVYDGVYDGTSRFANMDGGPTETRSRDEITLWRTYQKTIGGWDAHGEGLGGWSLDVHHSYDPIGRTLYLGDGSRRTGQSVNRVIDTAAGTLNPTGQGDGGPATQASLNGPKGVAVGPDGSVYIADFYEDRVRRVDRNGYISSVAGSTQTGDKITCSNDGWSGDNGPATNAQLDGPTDIALAPDGSLYIADSLNRRIRRVDAGTGDITTVAGNGCSGSPNDGILGKDALLSTPYGVAVAPDGALYIAEAPAPALVRKVGTDGIITTVAGAGQGYNDGGLAVDADLIDPRGVALGPDGSLYIADSGDRTVRRVWPSGIITTVAGTHGTSGQGGDGGPATAATLGFPEKAAVAPDGGLYIADTTNNRVRRVDANGTITAAAGNGGYQFSTDGAPATQVGLASPEGVAVGRDGSLQVSESGSNRVRRVHPPLPGFTNSDIAIPSDDGSELYQFDSTGRHLRTLNALTGAVVYSFGYTTGRLSSITDGDGNVTTIQRDSNGTPTAVVPPFGGTDAPKTMLGMDSNGYLSSVSVSPSTLETDTTLLEYYPGAGDGLLHFLTDPKGHVASFEYDSLGRLTKDNDRAAGFKALTRTKDATSYETTITTKLGRSSRYKVEDLAIGGMARTFTAPSGLQSTLQTKQDGSSTTTTPDGTTTDLTKGPDPRFGMQSPLLKTSTAMIPGNHQLNLQGTRQATLGNPDDPLSLQTLTDTLSVNGHSYLTAYQAATKRFTTTSPASRTTTTDIDSQGRPVSEQVTGIDALGSTYDAQGFLTDQTQGSGQSMRHWHYTYDPKGFLQTVTDPLSRTTTFVNDRIGRVTMQTLPDGSEIDYEYDKNGNIAKVKVPAHLDQSRPEHTFTQTPVDLLDDYTAPQVGSEANVTHYSYNDDRDLTSIVRPDNKTVSFDYNTQNGRLEKVTQKPTDDPNTILGETDLTYNSDTDNLATLTAPSNEQITFGYDGSLPTLETFSGPISGSVGQGYDNDLRLNSSTVNSGFSVSYSYDSDSLLTGAGQLSITPDSQNGLLRATSLGNTTTALTPNEFGELASLSASYGQTALYVETLNRDNGGRIYHKSETTSQGSHTYDYTYDDAGRLTGVSKNGGPSTLYGYDGNGNRIVGPSRILGVPATGTYDAQDRLTSYGTINYTYTAAGDLQSRTDTSVPGSATTTYDYDALGSLKNVTLPNSTSIDYLSDGFGRRIAQKRNGQLVQGFLYGSDALGPAAELDSQGNVQSRFVYATRTNVPDYMVRGGVTYRIITDELGSPRTIVDANTGQVAQELDYDEFGNVVRDTNPGFQPFGFAGGLYDHDTKLVRFGARDYDPETGRWTTKDPIRFAGRDTNLYGYVVSDPVNSIDLGGFSWNPVAAIGNGLSQARNFAGNAILGALGLTVCAGPGSGVGSALGIATLFIPVAGEVRAGSLAAKGAEELLAAKRAEEGIYVIKGSRGSYVGHSRNISVRLGQHVRSGRFTQAEVEAAERVGVRGGRTAREIAEQQKIDELGGIDALLNVRNPIGQRRLGLMAQPYSRP